MGSKVVRLGPAVIDEAIALAEAGVDRPWIRVDHGENGLQVRVERRRARWILRYKGRTITLGRLGPENGGIRSVKLARAIASDARDRVDAGMAVDQAWVAARRSGLSAEEADAASSNRTAREEGKWTWEDLVERYADWLGTTRMEGSRVKPGKPESAKDARRYLAFPALERRARGKLLSEVTLADVEAARDEAAAAGRKRPPEKIVTYVRAALTWARRSHRTPSGLEKVAPWWLELHAERKATEEDVAAVEGRSPSRPLTPTDVARVLYAAEMNRDRGEGSGVPMRDVTLSLLWFLGLTGQRSRAATRLRVANVEDRTDTDGWWEVYWPGADMKGGRHFVLPLPPEVYERTVARALSAIDRREDSRWVFPGRRRMKEDKPVVNTTLNGVIYRLRGRYRGADLPDLLEGVPEFTPHKLRAAMASFLSDSGFPGSTASAILDHSAGAEPAEREAAVTRAYYNMSHRVLAKLAGLAAWSEAVNSAYEAMVEATRQERRRRGMSAESQVRRVGFDPTSWRPTDPDAPPPDDPDWRDEADSATDAEKEAEFEAWLELQRVEEEQARRTEEASRMASLADLARPADD